MTTTTTTTTAITAAETATAINERTLLDEWVTSGSDYKKFKEALTSLSECTEFVKVDPVEISLLSFINTEATDKGEKARFWELCPCNTGGPQEKPAVRSLALDRVLEKGDHAALLREVLGGV